MAIIDTLTMVAGDVVQGRVIGFQLTPMIGTIDPLTIQGVGIVNLVGNTFTIPDSITFQLIDQTLDDLFFDSMVVTNTSTSTAVGTFLAVDAAIVETGGFKIWTWTSPVLIIENDTYQINFIKETAVVSTGSLQSPLGVSVSVDIQSNI